MQGVLGARCWPSMSKGPLNLGPPRAGRAASVEMGGRGESTSEVVGLNAEYSQRKTAAGGEGYVFTSTLTCREKDRLVYFRYFIPIYMPLLAFFHTRVLAWFVSPVQQGFASPLQQGFPLNWWHAQLESSGPIRAPDPTDFTATHLETGRARFGPTPVMVYLYGTTQGALTLGPRPRARAHLHTKFG